MKKIKHLFSLLILSSVLLVGCQPEEEDPTPSDDRDKFIGTWSCAETSSQNGSSTFEVHINKSTTSTSQVVIENFYNYGFNKSATASISGSSLTIASQSFSGTTIQGSGTSNSSTKISMNYTVNDGSDTDTVSAVLTKK
jgi:hypothetical protein